MIEVGKRNYMLNLCYCEFMKRKSICKYKLNLIYRKIVKDVSIFKYKINK